MQTKKQKDRERMAQMCNKIAGGKSIYADQLRATNRRVEKRKREQQYKKENLRKAVDWMLKA